MPKFLVIGYGDRAGYDRTDPSLRDAAHAQDARLKADGALMGVAGQPIQVRNHEAAGVSTNDGRYMQSDLPVAGFSVIDADSLDHAVELVAGTPCPVAHGVAEVWPLDDPG